MEVWKAMLSALAQSEGFPAPVEEHVFHPERRWRFDLAFPTLKVALEKEGMAPTGGKSRHTTRDGYADDCEKYANAALMGWIVIRATMRQIEHGVASGWILAALKLASGRATTTQGG